MQTRDPHETRRGYAVSPAIGPLPAIAVSGSPGQASPATQLRRAPIRAARLAFGWAGRRLRHHAGPGRRGHRTGR
jgi:hypothetical protein